MTKKHFAVTLSSCGYWERLAAGGCCRARADGGWLGWAVRWGLIAQPAVTRDGWAGLVGSGALVIYYPPSQLITGYQEMMRVLVTITTLPSTQPQCWLRYRPGQLRAAAGMLDTRHQSGLSRQGEILISSFWAHSCQEVGR